MNSYHQIYLIFRTIKEPVWRGKVTLTDDQVKAIIIDFKSLIESKESRLLLVHGLAEALRLYDKIEILWNEHYFPILKTYEDSDIYIQFKAVEKIKEYLPILSSIMGERQTQPTNYSPEQFIANFYPVINQFNCCFNRNELYFEVFGLLKKYKTLNLNPRKLITFVNSFPLNVGALYHTSITEFIVRAEKYLEIEPSKVRELIIC
jgi:hypothetical protein